MNASNPYTLIITRLEDFMRRYLRNRLVHGSLASTGLTALYLLVINGIEYFAYLPGKVRFVLLAGFLILLLYTLIFQVFIPAYRLLFFRKFMSREKAAQIIGERLPEVSDKLLNLLQLGEKTLLTDDDNSLLSEAIKQKSDRLSLVPFFNAIDKKKTKRVVRWSLIPLAVVLLLLMVFPSFLVSPSTRFIRYNTVFEKPLPYQVTVTNTSLEALHNEDFVLQLSVTGQEIPEQFYLIMDGMKIEMNRSSAIEFNHTFRKVNRDIVFRISGGSYLSRELVLTVRSRPRLLSYTASLVYPEYLKLEPEKLVNPAFISVPAGTKIDWSFNTKDTDMLSIAIDSVSEQATKGESLWTFDMTSTDKVNLDVFGSNQFMQKEALLTVRIDVIRDEYPTITVSDLQEEQLSRKRFFSGFITDDYCFTDLSALLTVADQQKSGFANDQRRKSLYLQPAQVRQNFYYALDLDTLNLSPGQQISIQFRITDNDKFSGPKSSLSQVFSYQIPSVDMLDSIRRNQEQALEKKLETLQQNAAALKKEIQKINRRMLSKPEPDQNDRAMINELVKQQLSLQQQMDQLKKERESINRFNKENELLNERLLEKQAMIDKLVEDVIPEDLKKMMEELERLLDKVNKDQLSDFLKKMEMSTDQMEKMLDRNLSLLKQLQFEKEMNALLERLDRLSEELRKNAEATGNRQQDNKQQLQQNLKSIEENFKQEMSKLDSLKSENNNLDQPFSFQDTKPEEEAIKNDLDQGSKMLQQKDSKGSSGKQQKASEQMKKLKDQLMSMMQMSEEEQLAEDARLVRYLLENVLRISFRQEELISQLSRMRRDDPAYASVARNQSMLLESFRVVDDSLTALARRQPMVGNFVLDEVSSIKFRIGDVQEKMKERLTAEAASSQQFAMMSLNNLALMLGESLKNMEESLGMPSSGKGKGKSKRAMPGNAMQRMREMQEALGKQLQEIMQGKQPGLGRSSMSEEIARMAAQQEALRQQMKNLIDQLKSEGQMGDGGLNKVLEDMEKLEERLVNRYLDEQTLRLQRNIEVRMLESEKALKEREREERRESFEFKGENTGNLIDNSEYNRIMKIQQDMLRTSPLDLEPFFRDRARNYFIRFNESQSNGLPNNR